jgi:SAM-dependent methyltransferase
MDNQEIYNENWADWMDIKTYGPASRWQRFLIKRLVRKIQSEKITSVLDVGCGEGTITKLLSRLLPDALITGIDFAESGITMANKRFGSNKLHFECDPENKLLQARYDLVCSFEVLEHIEVWQPFLQKLAESSHKYLLLSFPTGCMREFERKIGHYRNFQKGEVEEQLHSLGFVPLKIFFAGWPFYSPVYRNLCNWKYPEGNDFTTGKFGIIQKSISHILFISFAYFSLKKKGDQFVGLFIRKNPNA